MVYMLVYIYWYIGLRWYIWVYMLVYRSVATTRVCLENGNARPCTLSVVARKEDLEILQQFKTVPKEMQPPYLKLLNNKGKVLLVGDQGGCIAYST